MTAVPDLAVVDWFVGTPARLLLKELTDVELREAMSPDDLELDAEA